MIRSRQPEDLQRCLALLRVVHLTDRYPANWRNDPSGSIAGHHTVAAWVSEHHDSWSGTSRSLRLSPANMAAVARGIDLPAERLAVVSRFFVAPTWRKTGVGGRLMNHARREAGNRGLHLVLDVADRDHASIAFYENRGWHRVGRRTCRLATKATPCGFSYSSRRMRARRSGWRAFRGSRSGRLRVTALGAPSSASARWRPGARAPCADRASSSTQSRRARGAGTACPSRAGCA